MKKNLEKHQKSARRDSESGQAMLEYALVAFAIITAFTGIVYYFIPEIMDAYQIYIDSYYFILNLP